MQIVIDIPEELYKANLRGLEPEEVWDLRVAVKDGTPLPKGHGRLIDADRLREEMEKDVRRAMSFVDLIDFLWLAPTIIEADRSEEG